MKRRALACFLTWMMLLTLTACGGAKSEESFSSNSAAMDSWTEAEMPAAPAEEVFDTGSGERAQRQQGQGEKLIYTAELQMETTEFDRAAAAIEALTAECGGYFESSSVSSWGRGYRDASYTVRVPAERYSDFLTRAGALCHVLNKQEYTENVTEAYYDIDGRLKTQQTKLERLQELLGRAESMEDIITIESAISETEAQIEALSGQLRHYDALVDYSTVNISLQEVYKLSNVEEAPTTFGDRLGEAFRNGWSSFTNGLENLAVALAYGWMWVLVLAVIAVVVIRVLRRRRRARKAQEKPESPVEK